MNKVTIKIWNSTTEYEETIIHNFLTDMEAKAFIMGFKTAREYSAYIKFTIELNGKEV